MKLLFSLMFLIFTTCGANAFAEEMLESVDSFKIEAVATPAPTPTAIKMPQNRPNLATWNMACIGVQWQNRDKPAGTTAGCENLMKEIDAFYTRNSRGKFNLVPVFAGEMKVPYDCNRKNQSLMANDIRAQLKVLRPTLKLDVLILPQECTGAHAGNGTAHVKSVQRMTATHEVGHIVHFQHTGVYRKQPDGSFKNDAYADRDSIMGRIISNYLTAPQYYWNGWLNKDEYVLYTPETPEYMLKRINDITDKGGYITVIVPPQYTADRKYVFISARNCYSEALKKQVNCLKMQHAITGSWGGSIRIAEILDEHTDNNFSGLTVKLVRSVGKKVFISITSGIINEPIPTPTIAPTKTASPTPTKIPTIKPTAVPTKSPSPKPTASPSPTVKPTVQPTVPPVSDTVDFDGMPICSKLVHDNGIHVVTQPAMGQAKSFHAPTKAEIQTQFEMLAAWKTNKEYGITAQNSAIIIDSANKLNLNVCRVKLKDGDSLLVTYTKPKINNYSGPFFVMREGASSKIFFINPHTSGDGTFADVHMAMVNSKAMVEISNGYPKGVTPQADMVDHMDTLGAVGQRQINSLFPAPVALMIHGSAGSSILYRSRSPQLSRAYEEAIKKCLGNRTIRDDFNANYVTDKIIGGPYYLKTEIPAKIHLNNKSALGCMTRAIEEKSFVWGDEPEPTSTPVITTAPTSTPTVIPTKTPTIKPTTTPTPSAKAIPACPEAVDTNSAWAVFGPAIGQFRSYHRATAAEINQGNKLLDLMKNSKDKGITESNDKAMMTAANGIRGTLCRVTKPNDSYILLYAKKGITDYNGPNIIFREVASSRVVVIGPHDDSDFTHTVTKLATQRTNALATISNGQKRHVNSDSDFMHHSFNLGSKMVWKLNALYPKVVFLHTHGMANPNTVLYRSRSKILGAAYEKAVTSCTGFKSFTPRFNAYYSTEEGIRTGFYLKVENPVKFYHNRPGYLECIVKYLEANYSWAYEDVADDASDKIADIDPASAETEDEPNETPE